MEAMIPAAGTEVSVQRWLKAMIHGVTWMLVTWGSNADASGDKQYASGSDMFFVNESSGSGAANCIVHFGNGSRQIDIEELLQTNGKQEVLESDPLNITCTKWKGSWLLASVSGREFVIDPKKQQIRAEGEYVWHWSNKCRNPKRIAVAVMLSGETEYKATMPVCRIKSADLGSGDTQATLSFTLRSRNRSFFGEPVGTPVNWSIWEAGSEGDSITLGVSALQGKRVLLNTVHVAKPDAALASNFAQRLVVRTFAATPAPQTVAKTAASRQARTLTGRSHPASNTNLVTSR